MKVSVRGKDGRRRMVVDTVDSKITGVSSKDSARLFKESYEALGFHDVKIGKSSEVNNQE